jgi:hypothetical protein
VPAAVIIGAAYFAGPPPSTDRLVRDIVTPLLEYARLRQVLDISQQAFVDASVDYDPTALVRCLDLPDDCRTLTDLHETIVAHAQDVLHEGRNGLPWWELLVLRHADKGSGDDTNNPPSAVVIRIHHAIGDGLSLLHVFRQILHGTPGNDDASIWPAMVTGTSSITEPTQQRRRPRYSWWSYLTSTLHVLGLSVGKYDTDTAFSQCNHANMVHNGQRDVCIFPNVPLSFVKALKDAYSATTIDGSRATVNDVILAAVSHAIDQYCQAHPEAGGTPVNAQTQCRVLMPVGFPRTAVSDTDAAEQMNDKDTALANKWCMVSCDLAVGAAHLPAVSSGTVTPNTETENDHRHRVMVTRLAAIVERTTRLKQKPIAVMQLAIQNHVANRLPVSLARQTCADVFTRQLVKSHVKMVGDKCATNADETANS